MQFPNSILERDLKFEKNTVALPLFNSRSRASLRPSSMVTRLLGMSQTFYIIYL